jgi:ribonuclease HII
MKDVSYKVTSVSEKYIDSYGIVSAIQKALCLSLKKLNVDPKECLVLLDGGLHAPKEFIHQKTIIKGDEKEFAIALASVMAKVTRDRKMVQFSVKYPEYGFDTHKGYGTKKHYEGIKKHGTCDLHRISFLKKLR